MLLAISMLITGGKWILRNIRKTVKCRSQKDWRMIRRQFDGIFNFSTFLVASMPKSAVSLQHVLCWDLRHLRPKTHYVYSCDISYPGVSVCRTVPLFSLQNPKKNLRFQNGPNLKNLACGKLSHGPPHRGWCH